MQWRSGVDQKLYKIARRAELDHDQGKIGRTAATLTVVRSQYSQPQIRGLVPRSRLSIRPHLVFITSNTTYDRRDGYSSQQRIAGEALGDDIEAVALTATATAHQRAPTRRSERVASKKLARRTVSEGTTPLHHRRVTETRQRRRSKRDVDNAPPTAEALRRRRAALARKYAHVTCKFRLFDLPPELRECIYAYAMRLNVPRHLAHFRVPSLAMVSKQVRAEALPIFFSQGLFLGFVLSNYTSLKDPEALRIQFPSGLDEDVQVGLQVGLDERRATYGIIKRKEKSTPALVSPDMREGFTPVFRNVQLHVFSGYDVVPVGPNIEDDDLVDEIMLSIVVPPTTLRPHLSLLKIDGVVASVFPEEVAMVCDRIRTRIGKMVSAQRRFLGLSVAELEALASEFCCEPEPDSLND
ncbi:hypothetical protein LTR17_016057 [Elasticomyces elasticus]|nr:hypothetical protein LTR17_016057 [Elasticomyces elasticus]